MEKAATKSKAEKIRDWAQFVILLCAGVWAAATFYIKEIYIPANRPASLVVTGSLEEVGRKGEFALIRARVHVVNKREIKIFAPALWFTVTGFQFQSKDDPGSPSTPQIETEDKPLDDRYAGYSKPEEETVSAWRIPDSHNWYEQDDETTNDLLFYVPAKKYHALEFKIEWIVSRKIDDIALVEWRQEIDGSFNPTLKIKQVGFEKDKTLVENYDPIKLHKNLQASYGIGQGWYITALSFLPKR